MDASKIRIGRKLISAGALAVSVALIALTAGAPAAFAAGVLRGEQGDRLSGESQRQRVPAPEPRERPAVDCVAFRRTAGAGVKCVQQAHAAGFKVYLSLQWGNRLTPREVASYFNQVLPAYAPFVWAVGAGNEQDLSSPTGYGQGKTRLSHDGRSAGQNYRAVWNDVEPVLARVAPRAIRVYGEFSPWSFNANQQGFASGRPPGVQAIAAHCYHTTVGGLTQVPQDAAWAASKRLPLWCSEMGPALARTKPWAVPDTWASWNATVSTIEAESPNLKMAGYYYYPAL